MSLLISSRSDSNLQPVETFDPSNTSWLDDGDEDEGETEVRLATRKSTRPGPSADPDNMVSLYSSVAGENHCITSTIAIQEADRGEGSG